MDAREQIFMLQWSQLKHDESYHKDVLILPPGERVKHMALHNAKYTAYLFDAVEAGDQGRFERVLTDTFVIALATANSLNQDLGAEILDPVEMSNSLSLLGMQLAKVLKRPDSDQLWFVREIVRRNGSLAKACESLDHMEDVPFRQLMRDSNLGIFKVALAESAVRNLDIRACYEARIHQVEARSIFNRVNRRLEGRG